MTRVTVKKEGQHFVVNVGGRGMTLANTKSEANTKANEFRRQLKRVKKIRQ